MISAEAGSQAPTMRSNDSCRFGELAGARPVRCTRTVSNWAEAGRLAWRLRGAFLQDLAIAFAEDEGGQLSVNNV